MKLVLFAIFTSACASAQITYTPPVPPGAGAPGKIDAVAGSLTCTITGNAIPATSVSISCKGGATTVPYTVPVPVNAGYSFQWNLEKTPATNPRTSDAIGCVFGGTNNAGIKFDCVATAAGGTENKASGTL